MTGGKADVWRSSRRENLESGLSCRADNWRTGFFRSTQILPKDVGFGPHGEPGIDSDGRSVSVSHPVGAWVRATSSVPDNGLKGRCSGVGMLTGAAPSLSKEKPGQFASISVATASTAPSGRRTRNLCLRLQAVYTAAPTSPRRKSSARASCTRLTYSSAWCA